MGVETEYALVGLAHDGGRVDPDELARDLLRTARRGLVHLPEPAGNGMFLANGSRFYVDAGNHPEMATPECSSPFDVVRYIEAGERTLANLTATLTERRSDLAEVSAFKSNVDYHSESGATWGCHESYLHRMDPRRLPRQIIPHLVSRIIYTGAGGFDSLGGNSDFLISPRAPHLVAASSSNSTANRGIFHVKDESLSGEGYHRLHVISGESLSSRMGSWLKVGTTALVVAMCEAGFEPGTHVQLQNPVRALRRYAADPTCRVRAGLERSGRRTAIEIQRHYLDQAAEHLGDPHMPPWADTVCREWSKMLDALQRAPESVSTRLDWAIKWALFSDYLRRGGSGWGDLSGGSNDAVGERLYEIDMRYGQLASGSIFQKLIGAGVLDCDVDGVGEIESAMSDPPADSRARIRGECVRRLWRQGALCDWRAVVDGSRRLDLSDPFKTSADWDEVKTGQPLRSLFDEIES